MPKNFIYENNNETLQEYVQNAFAEPWHTQVFVESCPYKKANDLSYVVIIDEGAQDVAVDTVFYYDNIIVLWCEMGEAYNQSGRNNLCKPFQFTEEWREIAPTYNPETNTHQTIIPD